MSVVEAIRIGGAVGVRRSTPEALKRESLRRASGTSKLAPFLFVEKFKMFDGCSANT
jgi:hypothetical protein